MIHNFFSGRISIATEPQSASDRERKITLRRRFEMESVTTECIRTEDFECEFIPPLDLPEAHGLPWEQQLNAALAWQAAGGNVDDGGDSRTNAADAGAGSERYLPTMRTITRMNTVLVALGERLHQIQIEAANVAIGEMLVREAATSAALNPEDAFSPLAPENLQHIDALAASCVELLAAAQANLAAIPGFRPASARTGGTQRTAHQPWFLADRRQHATMIDFPDRRAAA